LGFLHSPIRFNTNTYFILITLLLLFVALLTQINHTKNEVRSHKMSIKRKLIYNMRNNRFTLNAKRTYSTKSLENKTFLLDRLNNIISQLNLNPVYVYDRLNLETTKTKILKDTKGLSGIYMIINITTKDYYIGSAATNRFYPRFSNHLIYFRGSKIVKSAVKKYGIENFAFVVLELYPNIVTKENNNELLCLEDKYLKLLLPNYNILTEAGSSFGYKHTEVDRQKMVDNYSDARREQIASLNRGKKFSSETIEKLREKALLRPAMSRETKLKCVSNAKPIILLNLDKTVYGKYSSILEAANAINCNEKTIRRAFQTEKKLVKKQWIVKIA